MPVDLDIKEHKIIGPILRKAVEQGRQEGRQEAASEIVRRLIEKRFGALPQWAERRLRQCTQAEADDLAMKFVDAKTLEEMFA